MSGADITLLNLNMLYVRYRDRTDRERHLPLGPLYLARALENAGFCVDFRDYQLNACEDPFLIENGVAFLEGSAPIIGISVMANLLPFALLLSREVKRRWPEKKIVLGGVGAASVEEQVLRRFPEIDVVACGEGERSGPVLVEHLVRGKDLGDCPNILYRNNGDIVRTAPCPRITRLEQVAYPAYHLTDLSCYSGLGLITSRGCPFQCAFCSVAPIWNFQPYLRSAEDIVAEIAYLYERGGTDLFLFQDEFFLASPQRAKEFSRRLLASGLRIRWKAFGRVNLIDHEAMELMARSGCVEIRYGIESGAEEVLARTVKGFGVEQAIEVVSESIRVFPSVDAFFIWGFPFETMEQFYRTVFLMNSFRMMGVRVLPSLLCYLPQTRIYQEMDKEKLEFSPELIPEYMLTGHETCDGYAIRVEEAHRPIYDFIRANKDLFPGFFHYDIENNVKPKLAVLTEFGFYRSIAQYESAESCGAHSPRVRDRALAAPAR
jgi:anaerobic magnesium-protoporphyrin IX monomethyl ester cyclase